MICTSCITLYCTSANFVAIAEAAPQLNGQTIRLGIVAPSLYSFIFSNWAAPLSICLTITDVDWILTKDISVVIFSGIGAFAAVVAAFAAKEGVNTWKKQLRGAADYQLAEEMLIAAYKYQELLHVSWQVAEHAIYKIESDCWMGVEDDGLPESYFNHWLGEMQKGRLEFDLVATKCAALWRGQFKDRFKWLHYFEHYCSESIISCIRLYDGSGYKPEKEHDAGLASANWLALQNRISLHDSDANSYLANLLRPLVSDLDEKRLVQS